jgi:hypothetical protein
MKRMLTTLVATGFLAVMAGPAAAGCGAMHSQSVSAPATSQDQVAQGEQSTAAPTQTATTKEKSE